METFAPVLRKENLRLVLSLAAEYGIELFAMDIQTAFLHSEVDYEIYIEIPRGFEDKFPPGTVLRLNKSLS